MSETQTGRIHGRRIEINKYSNKIKIGTKLINENVRRYLYHMNRLLIAKLSKVGRIKKIRGMSR